MAIDFVKLILGLALVLIGVIGIIGSFSGLTAFFSWPVMLVSAIPCAIFEVETVAGFLNMPVSLFHSVLFILCIPAVISTVFPDSTLFQILSGFLISVGLTICGIMMTNLIPAEWMTGIISFAEQVGVAASIPLLLILLFLAFLCGAFL